MNRAILGLALGASLALCAVPCEAAEQPSPKAIRVNGVELHYVDTGSGTPVIFVHGGLEDFRSWDGQVDAFAQHYRVIAYSRRYNYPNSGAAFGSGYSAVVDAEDLAALIRKLHLPPAHIVGVSYGGYVALELAALHPELVRSMVLAEPPLLGWLPTIDGGKPLFAEFMRVVWEPAGRAFRKGNVEGVTAAVDGFGELGYSGTDQKMTFASLPPEYRNVLLENGAEWKALTLSRDAFPPLSAAVVKRIQAPTLLLSGQKSLPLANLIDGQLNRWLPHAQRIILDGATHEMWNEYPEACRAAALAFIEKH